jgi:hypothetical protein
MSNRDDSRRLLRALLRACAHVGDEPPRAELEPILAPSSALRWREAVELLVVHRLAATAYAALGEPLLELATDEARTALRDACRDAFVVGALQMRELAVALDALEREGVEPALLKGAALATTLFPSVAARPMVDVDLLVEPADEPRVARVFAELGWTRRDEGDRRGVRDDEPGDARDYVTPTGVRFDVAHRFRVFESLPRAALLERRTPHGLARPSVASLEPNAALVHLVVHMNGHRHATGHWLAWFVDVALLLRRRAADLDAARLRTLVAAAGGAEPATWLWRTVDLVERELGVATPPALARRPPGLATLTLEEVLRSRARATSGRSARSVVGAVASIGERRREAAARRVVARWLAAGQWT